MSIRATHNDPRLPAPIRALALLESRLPMIIQDLSASVMLRGAQAERYWLMAKGGIMELLGFCERHQLAPVAEALREAARVEFPDWASAIRALLDAYEAAHKTVEGLGAGARRVE